jgi:hypothetical protein
MKQIFIDIESDQILFVIESECYPSEGEVVFTRYGSIEAESYTVNEVGKAYQYNTTDKTTKLELQITITKI